jgi:hypothetical protein
VAAGERRVDGLRQRIGNRWEEYRRIGVGTQARSVHESVVFDDKSETKERREAFSFVSF